MADNTSPIALRDQNAVRIITLNRPEVLNALTRPMLTALLDALEGAADGAAAGSVRAVLLTGAGRGFCAGADLSSLEPTGGVRDPGPLLRECYHPVIERMRSLPMPIVAAVNGTAAGAGMSLALACDIVLAARSANFVQVFARIGLVPDAGSTWFLPRLVGDMRARALTMLTERLGAAEAHRMGLVWQVFDDAALNDEAIKLGTRLATMPTRAYALTKRALQASAGNDLAAQLELECELQREAARTSDCSEGIAAFLEKRAPAFTGR